MYERVFKKAAQAVLRQDEALNAAREGAIEKLVKFLESQDRHGHTTFLRLARRYIILLETDPLLVGYNRTYIFAGNGTGGLFQLDKDISNSSVGIAPPGLRASTPTRLVDELIAHGTDPSTIVDHILDEVGKIAAQIIRSAES